jgi:hypothetical protein
MEVALISIPCGACFKIANVNNSKVKQVLEPYSRRNQLPCSSI